MPKVKIEQGDWVIVCDGQKALILENAGDEKFPNLQTRNVIEQDNPPTHVQGTDAPGRSHGGPGSNGGGIEQTDWHRQEEERFLRRLVDNLESAVKAGTAKAIVIVAPPRAMGVIRDASSKNLKAALRAEVDKDYVRMPVYEIEKHLTGMTR
jgi:protein required for attachment to host cells